MKLSDFQLMMSLSSHGDVMLIRPWPCVIGRPAWTDSCAAGLAFMQVSVGWSAEYPISTWVDNIVIIIFTSLGTGMLNNTHLMQSYSCLISSCLP